MYDRLQLTNMLRSEVERIPETGLPLEVFPARIQELVLNLARYENFNVEYTASILLSAVATAIGNSCRIRIKGEWKTSPSIYMMLVGRPGLGKTPPLGFLYRPIREHDDRMYEKYNEEWNAYEKALALSGNRRGGEVEDCTLLRKPQLVTTVISDFRLRQCLFGEHLLNRSTSAPVMLVESEKTAVVMCHFIPDYIWLATGGKNGSFNREAMSVLRDREVTLIPDLGATERWREKSALLAGICKRVVVSDMLERLATDEQRSRGLDIADFFLYSPSKRQILHQMIQRNPALQLLIDELDLELIE